MKEDCYKSKIDIPYFFEKRDVEFDSKHDNILYSILEAVL